MSFSNGRGRGRFPNGQAMGIHGVRGRGRGYNRGPPAAVEVHTDSESDASVLTVSDRTMPLHWRATCPRCMCVFGRDEDGRYEEDQSQDTLGARPSMERTEGVLPENGNQSTGTVRVGEGPNSGGTVGFVISDDDDQGGSIDEASGRDAPE